MIKQKTKSCINDMQARSWKEGQMESMVLFSCMVKQVVAKLTLCQEAIKKRELQTMLWNSYSHLFRTITNILLNASMSKSIMTYVMIYQASSMILFLSSKIGIKSFKSNRKKLWSDHQMKYFRSFKKEKLIDIMLKLI